VIIFIDKFLLTIFYPNKIQNFKFYAFRVTKISSGWVKKYLDQSWVGLFFTAGQKYAQIGSGQAGQKRGFFHHVGAHLLIKLSVSPPASWL